MRFKKLIEGMRDGRLQFFSIINYFFIIIENKFLGRLIIIIFHYHGVLGFWGFGVLGGNR